MRVAALLFNTSSSSEPTSSIHGYCILLITWGNSSAALCNNYFFLSLNGEVLPFCVKVAPNSLWLVFLPHFSVLVFCDLFSFCIFCSQFFLSPLEGGGGGGKPSKHSAYSAL